MERSDKLRSQSHKRPQPETNLPSLKSSLLMSKAMFALSKVDIDSRAIQKDQKERAMRTTSGAY
jgi:hypothetical protein